MKIILILCLISPFILAQNIVVNNDLKKYFDDYGHNGCFILYDLNNDSYVKYNPERCSERFIPASTFKIFNSLTALESGVIKDENVIIKWDGVKRSYENWNQDLDMKRAFKYSAVWFYQDLARKIGYEKMKFYITANHYGNENIEGGIDKFWLQGDLRISPEEQITFLKNLFLDSVKFSKRTIDIVKKIMIYDQKDDYILRAKTGWGNIKGDNIGWFVGYVETSGNVYFFVTNVESKNPEGGFVSRINITYNILKFLNIID
jgi:beta-lactamase class D